MPQQYPRYTVASLAQHSLQKLTARDVQGARRINPRARVHPNVHYVSVQTANITDRGRTFTAIDRNASILARLTQMRGDIRIRFVYGIKDDKGHIRDAYSTSARLVKEYSWDEMRMFFPDESGEYSDIGQSTRDSPLKAKQEQIDARAEKGDESLVSTPVSEWPMLYIVWEKLP